MKVQLKWLTNILMEKKRILIHGKNSFHGKLIATSQITDSSEVNFSFQKD